MQLLNVALGGTLYQDIPSELPHAGLHDILSEQQKESRIVHTLRLKPECKLAKIVGDEKLGANAYHHQAIKDLGKDLVASAWAEDDVIEAIELPDHKFVIGVQSHPESLEESIEQRWRKLFEAFVQATT